MMAPRDRRTLAVGLTVVATLLAISRGLPSWHDWVREARAGAAEQSNAAARTASLVRVAGPMRDSLLARNARYLALAPSLLAGASSADAGATLASVLSAAAAESGVKLGAVQIRIAGRAMMAADKSRQRNAAASAVFARVRAQGDVTGDVRGLTRFLLTLERGPLRLAVRDLTVTQSDPVGAAGRSETLHADIVVEGLAMAARPR